MTNERADDVTIGTVAERVGVTIRTLRHWDQVGLAAPSARTPAGYRLYTEQDIERIERVLAYRDSGLSLDEIREVLDHAGRDVPATLRAQRSQLAERIEELQLLDTKLARMADAHEHGILLDDDDQIEMFGSDWDPRGAASARDLWGDSPQWAQFAERSATRSRAEWQRLADEMRTLQTELANAKTAGVEPGSVRANALATKHRELFSNFFPLTLEMQVCLGRMFEADPGFAAHYNRSAPDLATWFRSIIDANARSQGVDPDQAQWR